MKTIPTFKNEKEEREFWENSDSTKYIDWNKSKKTIFPNLKKTTKTISIRLPVDMLDKIKVRANDLDIPYQSLIKIILQKELQSAQK